MIAHRLILFSTVVLSPGAIAVSGAESSIPHLRDQGTAKQLIVGGQPLLMREGEIGNSTATNPEYLRQFWPMFARLNLNTLLVPVYWHLVEPVEGTFDFSSVNGVISQARERDMRLVLLCFGSWKNSMSCYAPDWVKRDPERFDLIRQLEPLILERQGQGRMAGLLAEGPEQRQPQQVILGDYVMYVTFERGTPPSIAEGAIVPTGAAPAPPPSGGLRPRARVGRIHLRRHVDHHHVRVDQARRAGRHSSRRRGPFRERPMGNIRWLSGDQTHQGRHVRLVPGEFSLQRVALYEY